MKRFLVISLVILVVGFLVAGFAIPILAHGPAEGTWETMHEACEEGDWEAMTEAAEEVHGEDFDYMPCHDEDDYAPANRWGGMGGHMDRGMMGW